MVVSLIHSSIRSLIYELFHMDIFNNKDKKEASEQFLRTTAQASYNQLLARAGLPTLHNRRLQDLSILMYKVKHKLCPYYLCDFFNNNPSTYNLRQSDFTMPRFNSVKYGKHSIRYLGPKVWSKLSKSIREATSLSTFKTKIRNVNNLDALLDDGCRGCLLCCS